MNTAQPISPQQRAAATNNILNAIQTRITELRREADALEHDVRVLLAGEQQAAAAAAPGAPAADVPPVGEKLPVGPKPSEKRANGHAPGTPAAAGAQS